MTMIPCVACNACGREFKPNEAADASNERENYGGAVLRINTVAKWSKVYEHLCADCRIELQAEIEDALERFGK